MNLNLSQVTCTWCNKNYFETLNHCKMCKKIIKSSKPTIDYNKFKVLINMIDVHERIIQDQQNKINELEKKVKDLELTVIYAPNGSVAKELEKDFNELQKYIIT